MSKSASRVFYLFLWIGSFAILVSSLVYFRLSEDEWPPFLIERLPLPNEDLYLRVLQIHAATACLALPGCLILSSKIVLKRWPTFHRWCGRLIAALVIAAVVPTGAYLALFARGGLLGTLGFLLSGFIVLVAMVQAIRAARSRQYPVHRRFTFHVLGQLSVAVTSRTMLYVLESSQMNQEWVYLLSLWIPVLGTFAFIELVLFRKLRFNSLFQIKIKETL